MKTNVGTQASPLRSVRYMGGSFYDTHWVEVFTPLTPAEGQVFLTKITAQEARVRRTLMLKEIDRIVKEVQNAA